MMVMGMAKYTDNNFLGKTLYKSFRKLVVSVLLVSWWYCQLCFGGRWCLGGTLVMCPQCCDGVR